MSSEEKTNEINTLILRKIADKFKIPHEKLSILAESEKNSSDKYLQLYTTFFKKIFKPDAIESDSVIDSKNLLDIIKHLFSGTIDLSSGTKDSSTKATVLGRTLDPTSLDESIEKSGLSSLDASKGKSGLSSLDESIEKSGLSSLDKSIETLDSSSLDESRRKVPLLKNINTSSNTKGIQTDNHLSGSTIETQTDIDKPSITTVKKTSTPNTGDNVVIETKFDKIKSTKYLNYNANSKKIIMSENPTK